MLVSTKHGIMIKPLNFGPIHLKNFVPDVLWFVHMQHCYLKLCCGVFIRYSCLLATVSKSHDWLVVLLSLILTINMSTDVWSCLFFLLFISVSLSFTWCELGVNLLGYWQLTMINNSHESFLLVNNLSHCRMMNSKVFGNGLITLSRWMGSNKGFSKTFSFIILLTHTWILQTSKLPKRVYRSVHTCWWFIKCIWLTATSCY